MAKDSLFGNIFDVDADVQSSREKSALSLAQLSPGRVQVAGSGMAGSMLGGGVMEGLGYQNPEQQKQQAINEVWQEVGKLDLDDAANRKIVGNAFIAKGLYDIGMDILQYDDKTTTAKTLIPRTRTRNVGNIQITEDWNPDTQQWVKVSEAPRWQEKSDSTSVRKTDLQFEAKLLGCDLSDSVCKAQVEKNLLDSKGIEDAFSESIGGAAGKQFIEVDYKNAKASSAILRDIDIAVELMDEGVRSGTFAQTRNDFAKFFNTIGLTDDAKVSSTEALISTMSKQVANLLATGALGAGTGLSDKDVEFAKGIVGGSITWSEDSIRRVLYIQQRLAVLTLNRYKTKLDSINPKYFERLPFGGDSFQVEIPSVREIIKLKRPDGWQSITLSDGRKAFLYPDGTIHTADGTLIPNVGGNK